LIEPEFLWCFVFNFRRGIVKATNGTRAGCLPTYGEIVLPDQHQVNSLIAKAICDCRNDHPEHSINPEEAKQIAKCIIEALSDAGLQIIPANPR
jgi:hypothetical protein